jgi:L-alanine-DL-glutamate epimerase-like enolase superfamily enzyme
MTGTGHGSGSGSGVRIERVDVAAFRIPTEEPESDGTLQWDSTTLVVVEILAGDRMGTGYSYASPAAAHLVRDRLAERVRGRDPFAIPELWNDLVSAVRNIGRPGIASHAIAAIDVALWDLKARLLELPLVRLLGKARDDIPVYGSGGFTSQSSDRLREQLGGWAEQGIGRVKMKVGRDPRSDPDRVRIAREAIGPDVELFVDANGAYSRKQALYLAYAFAEHDVTWFEEPVSSDDLEGLRLLRDRSPPRMEIAAGEYGYDEVYFRRMLEAGAVDVLMPDATRCAGITGLQGAAALGRAFGIPLSAHTAPALHLHACCAVAEFRHLEWFHDHARIERMLFDGAVEPVAGRLRPDTSRPGLGLELRRGDAERFAI